MAKRPRWESKNDASREEEKILFSEGGGGINIVFWLKYTPLEGIDYQYHLCKLADSSTFLDISIGWPHYMQRGNFTFIWSKILHKHTRRNRRTGSSKIRQSFVPLLIWLSSYGTFSPSQYRKTLPLLNTFSAASSSILC
jgi:hypothetical protein